MDTYIFTVDLYPSGSPTAIIWASQYDVSRPFQANLQFDRKTYHIPDGAVVTFEEAKPDGNVLSIPVGVGDTYVTFATTEQMTAVSGKSICQIKIDSADGASIGTANFILAVEPSPMAQGAQSESVIDSVTNAIQQTSQNAISAAESAKKAEAATSKKQDITPTEAVTDPADHALQLVGNAQIDYATLANAIIAKLKSEDVVQAQTNNANKLISAALAYSMNQSILQLEDAVAEYRLMIDPETGHMALAHYTKEA